MKVNVIGAGLAGCEAAYQLAKRGIQVKLYEMKPKQFSPAHKNQDFCELVCSNSLRSNDVKNAVGLLKEEMRLLDSLIMKVADETKLPAGSALAVDRETFSKKITDTIYAHPNIEVVCEEVTSILEGPTIIATGPLTSSSLYESIRSLVKDDGLFFFDAAAPIIEKDSINFDIAYYKSRYDKGTADYINCPMTKEQFETFYDALINAQTTPIKDFEKEYYFDGCMPVEVMAKRGEQTLLYGPMKPVGLRHNGNKPYAVVQLRQDNVSDSLYNIVGFQTHLTWPEQKRVFSMIPGLENCNIVRYGVMHRNTYINSPLFLKSTYQFKQRDDLFFAGQITGVEGYVESCASGLLAAINMYCYLNQKPLYQLDNTTMIGAMAHYIAHGDPLHFQPINANYGIIKSVEEGVQLKKIDRKSYYANRAIETLKKVLCNEIS